MNKYTRANNFDRRCGRLQLEKTIELSVGNSILDIGCGIGEFTRLIPDTFSRIVGLDPSVEFIKEAEKLSWRRSDTDIEWVVGWGETFELNEKFDTITMTNLLEHVDNPIELLTNCKKHLARGGRIIAQVPNAESITRRLGVLMGIIDGLDNITEKEKNFFGHKRVYFLPDLESDARVAGLKLVESGGLIYKPLPNEFLEELCQQNGEEWAAGFIKALAEFGKDRPRECAYLYICTE